MPQLAPAHGNFMVALVALRQPCIQAEDLTASLSCKLHALQLHIADDNVLVKHFRDRLVLPRPAKSVGSGCVTPSSIQVASRTSPSEPSPA